MRLRLAPSIAVCAGLIACPSTFAASGDMRPAAAAHDERLPPGTYMTPDALPAVTQILPPPPLPGSPEAASDEAVYQATRHYDGSPRWALAQRDAVLTMPALLADFSCALGFAIDAKRAPILVSLLAHAGADMSPEIDKAKDHWGKKRPYLDNDKPICVARGGSLDKSPSYPSGHTTLEYGMSLILAELVPDRAGPILQRGRTMGESRIVCGVHWLSDVQGGFLNAAALVSTLHGSDRFRADMEKARAEIAAERAAPVAPSAQECQIESKAALQSPLFRLEPPQ